MPTPDELATALYGQSQAAQQSRPGAMGKGGQPPTPQMGQSQAVQSSPGAQGKGMQPPQPQMQGQAGPDQMQSRMQAAQQMGGPPQISPEQVQADMLRAQGGVQLTPDQQMARYRGFDQQGGAQFAQAAQGPRPMMQRQMPPQRQSPFGKGGQSMPNTNYPSR